MPKTVAALVAAMTLEEKVAQLTALDIMRMARVLHGVAPADRGAVLAANLPELAPHGVGHFPTMLSMLSPGIDAMAGFYAAVQDGVLASGRFAIPALFQVEALNGVVLAGAPTYPTGIAQAATWDPALVTRMTELTRERLLAYGVRHALSPVLDLARDPRWGRVHETYGEDQDLVAAMAVAFVRGLQGGDLRSGVAACAKHFLGYAAPQGGLNMAGVAIGPRTLREQYARPFAAVIRDAGVATVMNSYSEVDGVPAAADPGLLQGLLRDELGFDGFVVSDYGSVSHLVERFGLAADAKGAAALALTSGVDTEFLNPECFSHLPGLVRSGELDEAVVDRAAHRVLAVKERLGLLDHLFRGGPSRAPRPVPAPDADRAHSLAIARRAIVLLHNDGVLPLATDPLAAVSVAASPAAGRVTVIGELAGEVRVHFGAYTGVVAQETQRATAQRRISDAAADLRALPTPGFPATFDAWAREAEPAAVSIADAFPGARTVLRGGPGGTTSGDLAEAARAAADADVALVVVGERTGRVGPVQAGEGYDSQDLRLAGDQDRLVEAVAATGTPVVVVLVSGRPLLLERVVRHAAAVLWAPLLGPSAGTAIADVVTGAVAPSGRLPITFPASVGQIPVFHGSRAGSGYDVAGGADALGYADGPARPLFPFGHGLGYTEFRYSGLEARTLDDVRVTVTNVGTRDGREVVQLYGRDVVASTVRPLRQLLAFAAVDVPAGESRRVALRVPADAFALLDAAGRFVVEPGDVELMVGASATDIRARATIRLT